MRLIFMHIASCWLVTFSSPGVIPFEAIIIPALWYAPKYFVRRPPSVRRNPLRRPPPRPRRSPHEWICLTNYPKGTWGDLRAPPEISTTCQRRQIFDISGWGYFWSPAGGALSPQKEEKGKRKERKKEKRKEREERRRGEGFNWLYC